MKWEVRSSKRNRKKRLKEEDIIKILLQNRGIKLKRQKKEFFKPIQPEDISLDKLGIDKKNLNQALKRIDKARKETEHVIVYGDYDADGVCATAILWETLVAAGIKKVFGDWLVTVEVELRQMS